MKILVLGAKGYIGSEIMLYLEMMGLRPMGFDKGDKILPESDITIHLASNIYGTKKEDFTAEIDLTMEVIKKTKQKIIFTSSAAVYGNSSKPNKEDQELTPINDYGRAKALIEDIIKYSFDGDYTILRLANVYSSDADHGFIANILNGGNILYSKGERVRDYVHLDDVIKVILEATLSDKWNGIYNISTGKGIKARDLFERLSKKKPIFKNKDEIEISILDNSKAKKNGFNPFTI